MSEKIQALDPDFKFGEAYKRNYCTLINFSISEVTVEQSFFVDSTLQKLQYPEKLFCVLYREWQNPSWFQLHEDVERNDYYWTSEDKAETFKKKMIVHYGLVALSDKEAFEVAQLNLDL
jgi:hypothetical protein